CRLRLRRLDEGLNTLRLDLVRHREILGKRKPRYQTGLLVTTWLFPPPIIAPWKVAAGIGCMQLPVPVSLMITFWGFPAASYWMPVTTTACPPVLLPGAKPPRAAGGQ